MLPYNTLTIYSEKVTTLNKCQLLNKGHITCDKTSTHSSLLEKCNYTTFHIRHIKAIASEVFKSLNNLNPNFMNKMFQVKDITYDLRDSNILCQPKFNKIKYGKNTFSYYGTHV